MVSVLSKLHAEILELTEGEEKVVFEIEEVDSYKGKIEVAVLDIYDALAKVHVNGPERQQNAILGTQGVHDVCDTVPCRSKSPMEVCSITLPAVLSRRDSSVQEFGGYLTSWVIF